MPRKAEKTAADTGSNNGRVAAMEESEVPVPGRCTDIFVQKKRSDRVSLFIEGSFAGGFYRMAIEESGIGRGYEISQEQFRELRRLDREHGLREQIFRWLSVRDHSSGEIVRKSISKGYTTTEARRALVPFIEKGYLNDHSFADTFARVRRERHGWGPGKIRQALAQKGVKKQYIDSVLEDTFPEGQLAKAITDAARTAARRLMRTEPGIKRRKKLVDFLIRRGFPGHTVMEKCDELLKKLENEEL